MNAESRKLEFPNLRGEKLAGRLELPGGKPSAYAIFAHCFTCSKDAVAASRISRALCARGIAVLRFDFTGLGNSEGDFGNTGFSSNIEDLIAAADYLRKSLEAPELLVGHSLGGAAVLAAATKIPETKAVAAIGAPSDPGHVQKLLEDDIETIRQKGRATVNLAGRRFEIRRDFLEDLEREDLPARLGSLKAALLIYHSPIDSIVGIDHARRIFDAARHPKSFISLDGADHLLSRARDSEFVASTLSAWASRYLDAGTAEKGQGAASSDADQGVVTVSEKDRGFAQRIQAGRHLLAADEPVSVGGTDTGPTPYGLLLAALGACTSMTLRMYADRKKWPLEHISVRLKHEKIHAEDCAHCEKKESMVDRMTREIELAGPLSEEQRSRLLEIANKCPVHRTLMGEKDIVTRLAP